MENNQSNIKALKSGVWYTFTNFFTKGISFLTMPIFLRLMTQNDIGNISNFTSWLAILTSIFTLDLHTSVTLAFFDYKGKINEYISSVLRLGSLVTIIIFIISLPFKSKLIQMLRINELEFYLLFIVPFLSPAFQMLQIKNRLEYKYKISAFLTLGQTIGSVFVSILLVILFENKLIGNLMGAYSVTITINLVIYIIFLIRSPRLNANYWKYAIKISLPLIIHVLSGQLLSSSDKIMISQMCGDEYNALYSVAYTCSMVVSILWLSMNTAWSPWAYEQMDKKNYNVLKVASKPYLLFFGIIVIIFLLIAPELLWFLGAEQYKSAIWVIPPVMIAFVFQFVYSLYVNIETFSKKQKYIAYGTIIAAILNILLNLFFIPYFGFIAAAYTTLVGYSVLFLVHFIFVCSLGKAYWYDTKFNFIFLASFTLILGLVQLLYLNNILRYTIIGILLILFSILLYIFRKELISFVRYKKFEPFVLKVNSIKMTFEKNKDNYN